MWLHWLRGMVLPVSDTPMLRLQWATPVTSPSPTAMRYCPPGFTSLRTIEGAPFGKLEGLTHASIVIWLRLFRLVLPGILTPDPELDTKRKASLTIPAPKLA